MNSPPRWPRGNDATSGCRRYQIKSRRLTSHNNSRQLGVARKLEAREFDELIAVICDEDLRLLEMWRVSRDAVAEYARWVPTLNGHRIHVKPP